MNYSITQEGKDAKHLCTIDEKNKTVSTKENVLVFDFSTEYGWIFNTGFNCIFITGSDCTFTTGAFCTFSTLHNCTFTTKHNCIFSTYSNCTFITKSFCTFNTLDTCRFEVGKCCAIIRRNKGIIIKVDKPRIIDFKEMDQIENWKKLK